LGDPITLEGWSGYAGGLDVVKNTRGTQSYYIQWEGFEIMYHVSTLLPFNSWDENKLQRSRVIGNDITNIIFLEGETSYQPKIFKSAVTHIYAIVRPVIVSGEKRYRVAVASKDYVPKYGPEIPLGDFTAANLRNFLLTKIINGHIAAQRSKGLSRMYSRPRGDILTEIMNRFSEKAKPVKNTVGKSTFRSSWDTTSAVTRKSFMKVLHLSGVSIKEEENNEKEKEKKKTTNLLETVVHI